MTRLFSLLKGITGRITTRLVIIVSLSMMITAGLGYLKLYQATATNSSIRIDRAARAAAALFSEKLDAEFTTISDDRGRPLAIRLKGGDTATALTFRDEHDALLAQIGKINQGAANLFRLNADTGGFDRFATTFRKPDGSMPPPMSISLGHPAYANLIENRPHLGEVPVMGRMRLAYLTPIQSAGGGIAGALAVDVGWVDDLTVARNELRTQIIITTGLILLLVATFGVINMSRELKPLRKLAQYADDLATETASGEVPYKRRDDEVGVLAQGLERVVALQNRLAHLAYTDTLTGLGNRSRYLADLEAALNENLTGGRDWILAHFDIDKFKQINDAYGQAAGDRLLALVATRLSEAAGPGARIARLAADQFALLIRADETASSSHDVETALSRALQAPFILAATEVHLTSSIGLIRLGRDAAGADEAHRNAGLALHRARAQGGDHIVVFSPEMNDALQDQLRMERMLREAIDRQEIELHFQPQIVPATNRLAGVEALARWTHPVEGPISPGVFIPVAETTGQIVDLGTLVLDMACAQAAKWRQAGFDFKHISVNVSPVQLWQTNFVRTLKSALKRHQVPGRDICIEITESVFVDNSERRIASALASIRALGVALALDDFGTGYSSLGYLNRLPFDQLKVDRSFVTDIDTDLRKQKVMRGIVELGHGLGFSIVVEGTETNREVEMVETMGCDAVQGFYHARPAPALLIPDMVARIARTAPDNKAISA